MISELTAEQESALLDDVVDYLEVTSDNGRKWADSEVEDRPRESDSEDGEKPSPAMDEGSEESAPPLTDPENAEHYKSPSGRLYAKKVSALVATRYGGGKWLEMIL